MRLRVLPPLSGLSVAKLHLRFAATVVLMCAAACASGTTGSTPAPASAPAPAATTPALMDHCPTQSEGPSMIADAIKEAHRALAANASAKLPPGCVVLAFGRVQGLVPDTLEQYSLDIAAAIERRGTDARDALAAQALIYSRVRRFAELDRAYDRLVLVDSQVPVDVVRHAAASARARGDSVRLKAIIARAAARSDAPSYVRNENAVLRQVGPLADAINQVRGLVKQNPKYVAGYPSIVANFGTLDRGDSVTVWVRRGLAQGVSRVSLISSTESFVNASLRHASLYASTLDWDAAAAAAVRVDSALPSPSTKYLIASLNVQAAGPRLANARGLVNGSTWWSGGKFDPNGTPPTRAEGCARLPAIGASLDAAEGAMSRGGATYATGVVEINNAIVTARQLLAELAEVCKGGK